MKKFATILISLSLLCGCETAQQAKHVTPLRFGAVVPETPAMDPAVELRQHNWGGGSCEYASLVSHLNWLGYYDEAARIRANYSGGESISGRDSLAEILDHDGFTYARTDSADPAFLDWCTANRLGAIIEYKPNHCINFVGHHGDQAWLLDNNHEGHYEQVPWEQFLKSWRGFGGNALTIISVPPPPKPNYPL